MHRCCHCHGRFGLVSHRFLFKRFCSSKCLGTHRRNLATAIEQRLSRWCSDFLTSLAFGKGRTSDEFAQRRYVTMPRGPAGALRRHR